jgi:hypothetical protein
LDSRDCRGLSNGSIIVVIVIIVATRDGVCGLRRCGDCCAAGRKCRVSNGGDWYILGFCFGSVLAIEGVPSEREHDEQGEQYFFHDGCVLSIILDDRVH